MGRLTINKNGQATITIPKEVIDATGWKNGDNLYIGKKEGGESLFIEKIVNKKSNLKKKK